ncbi:MAG: WbuC family cupin fold metalloprotein [Bacteroidota bacterium]
MNSAFSLALPPIKTPLTLITEAQIEALLERSRLSPRKRMILPFHKSDNVLLHRMLNAIQPQSYIPPHRHVTSQKSESIILLRGAICYFTFDESGNILEKYHLKAGTLRFGVDTEPSIFHSFIALEEDTVIYEVKNGPYVRETDKDFPEWSPTEGSEEATNYIKQLYQEAKN